MEQVERHQRRREFHRLVAVLLDHAEHRLAVLLVALVGSEHRGEAGGLLIRLAAEQRRDRARVLATRLGIVWHAEFHEQGTEVREPEAEFAEGVGVAPDLRRRVARGVHDDVLRGDEDVDGVTEARRVELARFRHELHEVDRREIAGRVVEVHVLAAGVRRVDPTAVRAGVPGVDRRVELHARIAAEVRGSGDHAHEFAGLEGLRGLARGDVAGLPLGVGLDRPHELVGHAHRVVRVLEENRAVGRAVERTVVARVDQSPGLALLFRLALDEVGHVGMVDVQDDHLGRATRLAA